MNTKTYYFCGECFKMYETEKEAGTSEAQKKSKST